MVMGGKIKSDTPDGDLSVSEAYILYSNDVIYGTIIPTLIMIGFFGNVLYLISLRLSSPKYQRKPRKAPHISGTKSSINTNGNTDSKHDNKCKSKKVRTKNIMYVRILAISDFVISVCILPVLTTYMACIVKCRKSRWFVTYVIKVNFPLLDIFGIFSNYMHILISLDRLWALAFPFSYRVYVKDTWNKYLTSAGFILCILLATPYSFGFLIIPVIYENTFNNQSMSTAIGEQIIKHSLRDKYSLKSINNSFLNQNLINNNISNDQYYRTLLDKSLFGLDNVYYTHLPNAKTVYWFAHYRRYINIMTCLLPLIITSVSNSIIMYYCLRIHLQKTSIGKNKSERGSIPKPENKELISSNGSNPEIKGSIEKKDTTQNLLVLKKKVREVKSRNLVPNTPKGSNSNGTHFSYTTTHGMKNKEFKITILMLLLNIYFTINILPMTLYMLLHQPWADSFKNKGELWFQHIAYLTKHGNNTLGIYIALFLDPTLRDGVNIIYRYLFCRRRI